MLNESNIPLEEDGIEEEILVDEEVAITKAMWGDVGGNIENQTDLQNALDAKQDSLTEAQLNAVNSGITSEKVTTYDGYADQIASKADQSALNAESTARGEADTALGTRIDNEATTRQQADNGLQSQIDAITSKSDVVDVVANYAALQAYDTSTLGNNDVVKVLDDETHEDALTYYRWSTTTQTWAYIGQEAPYYSKGQMDVKLAEKQDKLTAGANIQIQNGTISATDTKYTNGNGLNLNGTEFSADTTVLATKTDLEDYYTKTETDTKLAPKLEAEVVAELPTTGAEGKLYLTPKAHTTQTATGNPIEATITAQAGQLESFQLDGDTYQQSLTGKNLFNIATASDVWINQSGISQPNEVWKNSDFIKVEPNTTYTLSGSTIEGGFRQFQYHEYSSNNESSYTNQYAQINLANSATFTTHTDCNYVRVGYRKDALKDIQLEAGSTATSFEPYVGGVYSPNIDFPQAVNVVTGSQTVAINDTNYPLDLGTIELCKIGTYQDYIYKSGDDWKVHKATIKKVLNGSEDWIDSTVTGTTGYFRGSVSVGGYKTTLGYSNKILVRQGSHGSYEYVWLQNLQTGETYLQVLKSRLSASTLEAFETWLASNNITIYAVPYDDQADTTITDQTLIAQLEAVRTAALSTGSNTISNTATGTNLAGDMELGYYEYDPTNRYDKFIWLDLNNNYEQIGGE